MCVCVSVCRICLSACLLACLPACLSVCLSVCLFVYYNIVCVYMYMYAERSTSIDQGSVLYLFSTPRHKGSGGEGDCGGTNVDRALRTDQWTTLTRFILVQPWRSGVDGGRNTGGQSKKIAFPHKYANISNCKCRGLFL